MRAARPASNQHVLSVASRYCPALSSRQLRKSTTTPPHIEVPAADVIFARDLPLIYDADVQGRRGPAPLTPRHATLHIQNSSRALSLTLDHLGSRLKNLSRSRVGCRWTVPTLSFVNCDLAIADYDLRSFARHLIVRTIWATSRREKL